MKNGKYSETKNIFSFNKYAAGSTFHYQTELCWVSDMTGHRASVMIICFMVSSLCIKCAVCSKCFAVPAVQSHKYVADLIIFLLPFYRIILKHCCKLRVWCIKWIHICVSGDIVPFSKHCTYTFSELVNCVKGKAIPLMAWTGPEGSRRLRLPDFKTIGTWRW